MKVCHLCNLEFDDNLTFCHYCGSKLENKIENNSIFCPHCGRKIEEDSGFCPFCGKKINVDTNQKVDINNFRKDHQSVNNVISNNSMKKNIISRRKKFKFWSCDNFFSHNGRSGRLNYFLNVFFLLFIHGLLNYFLIMNNNSWRTVLFFPILLTICPHFCIVNRRFHDLNKSVYWTITYMILYYLDIMFPFVFMNIILLIPVIYLFFFKGTDGPNQYGEDPTKD